MDTTATVILLIGPEAAFRESDLKALHATDYEVQRAQTADAALTFQENNGANLALYIITEKLEPGRSGTQLLKEFRNRGSSLPAIIIAGGDTTPHLSTLSGENRLLPLSFNDDELRKAVEELLSDSSTYL